MAVIGGLGAEPTPRIMTGSLREVAGSHALRCDAKQSEERFRDLDRWLEATSTFALGAMLPDPIVKGAQPDYAETGEAPITVITTMAIQNLVVDLEGCRPALSVDYGAADVRKPRIGDVLLTVDGGTSIGKPVLFDLEGEFAVDSHVAILRPVGLDAAMLVHLLASPLGQVQFQRFESGASGQTAVTEDDIRRFRFPLLDPHVAAQAIADVEAARTAADQLRREAAAREEDGWARFMADCAPGLRP